MMCSLVGVLFQGLVASGAKKRLFGPQGSKRLLSEMSVRVKNDALYSFVRFSQQLVFTKHICTNAEQSNWLSSDVKSLMIILRPLAIRESVILYLTPLS